MLSLFAKVSKQTYIKHANLCYKTGPFAH